jgi:hypothetical protein
MIASNEQWTFLTLQLFNTHQAVHCGVEAKHTHEIREKVDHALAESFTQSEFTPTYSKHTNTQKDYLH